ncbi:MAG: hypothetical protein ACI8SE_001803 [Bacteroidia bacterium]|jgi:hypothetical protein
MDFDGKSSETSVLAIDITNTAPSFNVYPNPFIGNIDIDLNKVKYDQITVKDLTGKVMYNSTSKDNKSSFVAINTMEWPTGIYFLTVMTGGSQETKKIIRH